LSSNFWHNLDVSWLIRRDIKIFYRIWSFVYATLSRHLFDSKSLIERLSSKSKLTASNHLKKIRFFLTRFFSLFLRQFYYFFASEYEFSFWIFWISEALNDLEINVSLFQNVRSDLTWTSSMRQNFSSTHRKMNLSQFELSRFVSNYLINLNHSAWFHLLADF
jgi:hypothetical protein